MFFFQFFNRKRENQPDMGPLAGQPVYDFHPKLMLGHARQKVTRMSMLDLVFETKLGLKMMATWGIC